MVEITYIRGVNAHTERVNRDDLHTWLSEHADCWLVRSRPVA